MKGREVIRTGKKREGNGTVKKRRIEKSGEEEWRRGEERRGEERMMD